jgi:hypothetical protein
MSNNLIEGLLTPENIAMVEPLLNAAIDQRIQPLSQKIDNLAQGIQLLAQAELEKAAQQQPPAAPQQTAPAPQQTAPVAMPVETPTGFAYPQEQPPMQPTQAQPVGDKLASFAPLLMQYLSGQNTNQNNSLTNIAETLSAAAHIGNIMNKPMLDGITMATTMMSLAGRSGIEPSLAAETLGKMANDAQIQNTNGTAGDTQAG